MIHGKTVSIRRGRVKRWKEAGGKKGVEWGKERKREEGREPYFKQDAISSAKRASWLLHLVPSPLSPSQGTAQSVHVHSGLSQMLVSLTPAMPSHTATISRVLHHTSEQSCTFLFFPFYFFFLHSFGTKAQEWHE